MPTTDTTSPITNEQPRRRPTVLVMMATYNGAAYVREQIESVLTQHEVDVTLRICDDQSPDDTFAICQEYEAKDPRVHATRNEQNLGVGENFMQMVYDDGSRGYDYYAFCDQDDIWLPEKLIVAITKISHLMNPTEPTLYYSDVIDFDGEREWRELGPFKPCEEHPATLLLNNWASGCTMVFNQALRDLLCRYRPKPLPRIHDSWTHLVARYCGTVVADLSYSGIRRRITGNNVVGSLTDHHKSPLGAWNDFKNLFFRPERAMTRAAAELAIGFADRIKQERAEELYEFLSYHDTPLSCIKAAFCFDCYRPTLYGKALFMLRFALGRF
ncbi:MAG: glycosyltransferase [Atopobiaceae bacterium]|nr:glycosyltransferase [Atopobiaceae bacterium]